MTEGKPLPAWDTVSDSQSLGPAEETVKRRAEEVSAIEQHYHQLLCAARSTLGVTMSSRPHLTHSPVCVGQSFVTLPSFRCQ